MAGNVTAGSDIAFTGLVLAQRYQLSDEMPPGALCRLIRGDDLTLRRPVVVKAIPPEHADVYVAALRATSALTHPAAVAVYDAVREDEWLFLVQEAISGQALARYLRQGIPSERAVNLALQLAQALAYSHHREIVHGDLTPSAVIVDRQATVRVNNFGLPPDLDYFLAEGGAELQELIAEGTAYGDVLALGLLLRQMLSSAELAGSEHGTRQVRSDVPPGLAELVRRCTVPGASQEITDAATLTIALEELRDQLASASQPTASETPPAIRAMRDAMADQALWSSEQTVAREQVSPRALDRDSHEVGSRFERVTDPGGHSDGASTRATDGDDLAMPPRLRLPTRPLPEPARFAGSGTKHAHSHGKEYSRDDATRGAMLSGVLVVGIILFVIFFLIGYLGPFTLGGR